jgi:hypothetical protein
MRRVAAYLDRRDLADLREARPAGASRLAYAQANPPACAVVEEDGDARTLDQEDRIVERDRILLPDCARTSFMQISVITHNRHSDRGTINPSAPSTTDITKEKPMTEPEMLDDEAEAAEAEPATAAGDDIDNEANEVHDD